MPLPFCSEGKGVFLDLELVANSSNYYSFFDKNRFLTEPFAVEPTSVLEPTTISSTLSSSFCGGSTGGGGGASTDTNPSPKWKQNTNTAATSSNAADKCAMEDWESVLSESVTESPSQEQSIMRWIMGENNTHVDDSQMGNLNRVLQIGGGGGVSPVPEFDYSGGFGIVDIGGDQLATNFMSPIPRSIGEKIDFSSNLPINNNYRYLPSTNLGSISLHHHQPEPPIFNPQMMLNQHQQNPAFFLPQEHHSLFAPPPAKRHNSGGSFAGNLDSGNQISKGFYPDYGPHHHQQAVIDQLYKAAELIQTGNPSLAQTILARLNHNFQPIGKPFDRAAFYCKEALQSLITNNSNNNMTVLPFSLIYKIGAYKSFSEISPMVQFANFTCNQALLEALEAFDKIHIVDFDIGFGGQWASLMQELALRSRGAPMLKITALASSSTVDQIELGLARENLIQFASEINMSFEFEVMGFDCLNSGSYFRSSEEEGIAVNLPIGSLANHKFVLHFVKQLSPRIIVSVDRGCDRTDLSFPNHIIHALQSHSNLLESIDAVNMNNIDVVQKIEKFLIQPGFEKIVNGRFRSQEKSQHWRTLFLSSGFSPIMFSNFTESQAECVVKRTPVRGFQVEKRQSSLVLCWQRKELISASAWRC